MTFYEAALEVLRRTGRPLHYKKITERAINEELLSHIGKTPEETMESRLDQEARKSDTAWIVMTRPGVYSLKEDVAEELNKKAAANGEDKKKKENPKKKKKRRPAKREVEVDKPAPAKLNIRGKFDSVADAAAAVLEVKAPDPMDIDEIAAVVFDQKLVRFHTHEPDVSVETAMLLDNLGRARDAIRPRFRQYRSGRWGLYEWELTKKGAQQTKKIDELVKDLKIEAERQLAEALTLISQDAFEMIVVQLLNKMRYENIKVSKRSSDGDVVFAADWRRGFTPSRACVYVMCDNELQLTEEIVTSFREDLEHYSANEGVMIHIGKIGKNVTKTARGSDPKISVIDRKHFVKLLVENGIGVRTYNAPITVIDTTLVQALS